MEKCSYGKFTVLENGSTGDVLQESICIYINWLQNERIRLGGFFPVPSKLCGFILRAGGSVIGALSQRRPLASGICQRYNISEAEVLSQRRLLASGKPGSVIDKKEEACGPLSNQKPVAQSLMTDLGLTKTNIYYEECGLRVYLRYVTEFESRKTVQTESRTKPIGLSLLSSEHRLRLSIAETSFVSAFDLHCFWPRCSLFSVKPKKRSRLLIMTYRPLLAYSMYRSVR